MDTDQEFAWEMDRRYPDEYEPGELDFRPNETRAHWYWRITHPCDLAEIPADVLGSEEFLNECSAYQFLMLAKSGPKIDPFVMRKIKDVFNRRAETEESFKSLRENKDRLDAPAPYFL